MSSFAPGRLSGTTAAAEQILTPDVRAALMALPQPTLAIAAGTAVVEWHGPGDHLTDLDSAIALLAAVRVTGRGG